MFLSSPQISKVHKILVQDHTVDVLGFLVPPAVEQFFDAPMISSQSEQLQRTIVQPPDVFLMPVP